MIRFHLVSSHMIGKRHEDSSHYAPAGNYFLVTTASWGRTARPMRGR
jgi:hypothetical protein